MKKLLLRTMVLLCALVVGSLNGWAQSTPVYTLSFEQLTNSTTNYNSYTAAHTTTSSFIAWSVFGNQSMGDYIRVGGKNTTNTNRTLTSSSVLSSTKAIGKVVINHSGTSTGTNTTITVNSIKVEGSTSNQFTSAKIKQIDNPSVSSAGDLEFTLDEGDWDANSYFRITMNYVTAKVNEGGNGPNNSYLTINNVKFYEATPGTTASPTISGEEKFLNTTTVTITNAASADGASIYYTLNGDDPTTTTSATCFAYSAPFNVSATTTVKAIAKKSTDTNASPVVTKTFTKVTPKENIAALVAGGVADYVQLTDALVTFRSGSTAYLEDASGAIMLYNCAGELVGGDKITGIMNVTGYTVYQNLPEITAFSLVEGYTKTSANSVTPTVVTIAELLADYNSYLSKFVIIKAAKVKSAFSSRNCTIEQGSNSIILRDQNNPGTLTSTVDTYVDVIANVAIYNETKQIAVYSQSQIAEVPAEPAEPVVSGTTVTLSTTSNMAGWRTYNNNTAKKYTVDGTTKVYYASATGSSTVTLTEIEGGVPANTAVILHQTSGTSITLTETDDAITAPGASNKLAVSTAGQNLGMVFRLGYKSGSGKGVGFYSYIQNNAPAGIIYVATPSGARDFLEFAFGDDETTGVNEIKAQKVDGQVYDLQGRKVATPSKGLYIVNGKKIVIK